MNPSEHFFNLLDEQPRTPTSLLVRHRGETRRFPIAAASKAFELRTRSRKGTGRPGLDCGKNRLALLLALLEKDERDEP